jgi:hypothetical protein
MSRLQRGLSGISNSSAGSTMRLGTGSLAGNERQGTNSYPEVKRLCHG